MGNIMHNSTISTCLKLPILVIVFGVFRIANASSGTVAWYNNTPFPYHITLKSSSGCVTSAGAASFRVLPRESYVSNISVDRNCAEGYEINISWNFDQAMGRGRKATGKISYNEYLSNTSALMGKVTIALSPSPSPDAIRALCGPINLPCGKRAVNVGKTQVNITAIPIAEEIALTRVGGTIVMLRSETETDQTADAQPRTHPSAALPR